MLGAELGARVLALVGRRALIGRLQMPLLVLVPLMGRLVGAGENIMSTPSTSAWV